MGYRYKNTLPVLATRLEKILNAKMKAYEILCKRFHSQIHKLRLLNGPRNLKILRLKVEEADEMNNSLSSPQSLKLFCDGQVRYVMGWFTQMTKIFKHWWQKDFDWEHTSAEAHFVEAARNFDSIRLGTDEKIVSSTKTAVDVEGPRVQLFLCSEKLDRLEDESEKDECFEDLLDIVNKLSDLLGKHEIVAFAVKNNVII